METPFQANGALLRRDVNIRNPLLHTDLLERREKRLTFQGCKI
jgi:hypothetical protein